MHLLRNLLFNSFLQIGRSNNTALKTVLLRGASDTAVSTTEPSIRSPKILGHDIVTEGHLSAIIGDQMYYELPTLHLKSKRNNIFATLTDCNGRVLDCTSCGAEGFRHARKRTTVAAQTLGISIGFKARKLGITTVRLKLNGIGANRLSAISGVNLSGLKIVSISDDTNVHYGHGRRPKKPRRV